MCGITTDEENAPGLPDAAWFVLKHCGQPMRFRSSIAQRRGGKDDRSLTTSARYTCDGCSATLELHLTERDAG